MRLKLVLAFSLVVLVSVVTVVVIARLGAASAVRAFMFRGGMSGSEGLVGTLEDYYAAHDGWEGVGSLLSSAGPGASGRGGRGAGRQAGQGMMGGAGMGGQRLTLADAQGRIVADTAIQQPSGSLSQEELDAAIALESGGQTVGYLLPAGQVAFTQAQESELVSRLARGALTAGLIGGGLALLLALLLAYSLTRPVHALTRAAGQLSRGDLSQRVSVRGSDELARLGRAFNSMADSLQKSEASRRAMTADIAHELRNPLAVQRASLEALQDGIYPMTPENLEPILEQNRLLSRLVDDLQTLALAESGQMQLERAAVDLAALAQRVAERFTPQAAASQISIQVQVASALPTLHLDAGRVEQILGNLISNGLRFTPAAGRIEIIIQREKDDKVALSVHDSGPGIPQEALPHVFERFYRADRSRSRAEGGSGLGLAIARQLAEAHGGSLSAANHPQGGANFTLRFPVG